MELNGKTVVLGVTGGIAAYKSCELVSSLKKAGADVFVVMTKNACNFVSPLTFETLSNNRVISDMWSRDYEWEVEHISMAKRADVFVVAPCTANLIGKYACGIADDFLSTTLMAVKKPVLLAPAMNTAMMESAAYKANEDILKQRGVNFVYGGKGYLACGDIGMGRMAEPSVILERITDLLFPKKDLQGKTVLVTAGATSEPIDPVRFITNRSSGKMGCALSDAAFLRGANVILIHGKITAKPKFKYETIAVETTEDMLKAVLVNLERSDYIIKAAAPSDYKVENINKNKIKDKVLNLSLTKNPDIAYEVGKLKKNKKLIIFAAETEDLEKNARDKLIKKNADMIVANDVTMQGAGFNTDTNIVKLISKDKTEQLELMEKTVLADIILDHMVEL